jgi:uncharacterized protein (TIGR02266 family)
MRIRLKYADLPTFIERFSPNVSRAGLFIASRAPKAVGTTVRFELTLTDGKTKLLKGEGVVAWVREFDPQNPQRPHGMGVRFARLDAESRQMIDRIDAFKRERGLRDDGAVPQAEPAPAAAVPVAIGASADGRNDGNDGNDDDDDDDDDDDAPSVPVRMAPRVEAPGESLEALLSLDGPTIEEALVRARIIAARLVKEGERGDDALERLLRADIPSLGPPPLAPPPALILPPPADVAPPPPSPGPRFTPMPAAPLLAVDPEISEPTRVSEPPAMLQHDETEPELPELQEPEEERTRVRAPTPISLHEAEDVADVLDALDQVTAVRGDAATPSPPGDEDTPSQSKPGKKGFFSKLFKK